MTELLPCPFCGGEARLFHFSSAIRDEVWRVVCDKPFCAQGPDGCTEAEAIEAWNTRAERTCRIEGRYGNQYCTRCGEMVGTWDSTSELYIDGNMVELWNYCPNCGARVTKSDQDL